MKFGIILVHGYTGNKHDLSCLESKLSSRYGADSVYSIKLSGHNDVNPNYIFSLDKYISDIHNNAIKFLNEKRKLIFIGHSTGGVFILSALKYFNSSAELVILLGTPYTVDINYLKRWENITKQIDNVSFTDVSNMVSAINSTCSNYNADHPVILINGSQDDLVPVSTLDQWKSHSYNGIKRLYTVEGGKHQLFKNSSKYFTTDLIIRNIDDVLNYNVKVGRSVLSSPKGNYVSDNGENIVETSGLLHHCPEKKRTNTDARLEENHILDRNHEKEKEHEKERVTTQLNSLFVHEPKLKKFIENNPYAAFHITASPSFIKYSKEEMSLNETAVNDPIIANICISSHCNLKCKYCYRTQNPVQSQLMSIERFKQILGYLPNTYKITLVGSGEPLTHPNIVDFVKLASEQNRKVTIVTNGMLLTEKLSNELIANGLDSITLSIDYFDQQSADSFRKGTDFNIIKNNIQNFMKQNENNEVTTAVFSAVSNENFKDLDKLINFIAEFKIHVLMLSDLNFSSNRGKNLSDNISKDKIQLLRKSIKYGFSKKIIILTVRALEQFAIKHNFSNYLLIPPDQLFKRSESHTYCFSPWQTLPVNVNGNVSICDCQSEKIIGNIFTTPFSEIWNGSEMMNYRNRMISCNPSKECRICPRF